MLKNPLYVYGGQNTLKIPAHLNYGMHLLARFGVYKNNGAIINAISGEILSYEALAQQIVDIALSLARIGVRKGQVVSICSEKRMEFIPTVLGAICAGATFAPTDVTCGRATILHRINLAKPTIIFCSPAAYETHKETFKTVESLKEIIIFGDRGIDNAISFKEFLTEHASVEDFLAVGVNGWEDVAIVLYSSGTTGLPKGIPLTHLNLLAFLGDTGGQSELMGAKTLITREWYYSYGLGHTLYTLYMGSAVVFCTTSEERDFLEAIQKYKIEIIQLAPATVAEFANSSILAQYDVSSLVCIISASTPLSAELDERIKIMFPNLQAISQYYAMSEAGCVCSSRAAPKGPKPGSVGCVTDGYILKVVDPSSRKPLGPNQRGEICLKSPALMAGYLGDAPIDYLDEEGFFKTGDIGYYDEERYFYIIDRIKELIKFNSYQVAPAELEAVLLRHPGVAGAGVSAAPHAQYGEVPTAFVVLLPGHDVTAQELVDFVNEQVSYRMRLAGGVRFVASLPSVPNGKLDRKALKKILSEEHQ